MTAIGIKDTLEPDVLLLRQPVTAADHCFEPEQVALVVGIVSPGTKRRDRFERPGDYAAAGISHFRRIEQDPVQVFADDLIGERYELIAQSDTEPVLTKPFEIRLPIADITP